MGEPVVPYIFPQEPKTVEELEAARELYLASLEIASHDKLLEYLDYFEQKEKEAIEHRDLVETAAEKEVKSKMIIFWKGLKEEAQRRLK